MDNKKFAALGFVFLWFAIGGIAHFALTRLEMRIMPPGIPWPRAVVLVVGVFELLGAAGLLIVRLRPAAGLGLALLTIAVTPANVYMLLHADAFGVPYWLLVLRLPVQAALLALIAWSSDAIGIFVPGVRSHLRGIGPAGDRRSPSSRP
jgi:uncharacterized membrane protein